MSHAEHQVHYKISIKAHVGSENTREIYFYEVFVGVYPIFRYSSFLSPFSFQDREDGNDFRSQGFLLRTRNLSFLCMSTENTAFFFLPSKFLHNSAEVPSDFQHASA